MVTAVARPALAAEPRSRARPSGWLPVALVTVLGAGVLRLYGVSLRDTAAFGAYVALAVSLPGTLLWRAAHRRARSFPADVAAGTAVGYALEVLTYIPARALGLPLLVLAWPSLTILVFLLVRPLRRYWRGTGERVPSWWAWTLAAFFGLVVAWGAAGFFRTHGLTWPGNARQFVDMPLVLALGGELKHHIPPTDPHILGTPLHYHWFVYAETAATSWVTGIELQTLLFRLSVLPMVAVFIVLIAIAARRLTGGWWSGPITLGITYLVLAPNPVAWTSHLVPSGAVLDGTIWVSPTQTFGAALFAAAALLVIDRLRGGGDARVMLLLAVLLAAIMGAKSTYLPLLIAGLLLVLMIQLALRRRLDRGALWVLAVACSCQVFAQLILYGGATDGLNITAFGGVWRVLGASGLGRSPSTQLLLAMTLLLLLSWSCVWAGAFGLIVRPGVLLDPPILLLVGMGAAGMAGMLLTAHPGGSEWFFLAAVRPYLALAAVAGFAVVAERSTPLILLGGVCCGALIATAIRLTAGARSPGVPGLLLSYGLMIGVLVIFCLIAAGRLTLPLVLALATGLGLLTSLDRATITYEMWSLNGWEVSRGALEAGRWLRDHSSPSDVVATNAQCRPSVHRACDSRHFWISAYTERRILVEGWAHSPASLVRIRNVLTDPLARMPFWDTTRLAASRAAFRSPAVHTVARLRDQYGVRWLFVDTRSNRPHPTLASFARLRYRFGDCAVYEI